MRNHIIALQLHYLGVDHDHAHVFGAGAVQQAVDDGVDADGLAAAGLTGNEQMGHLGEVAQNRPARDVPAQRHSQGRLGALHFRA